MIQENYRNIPYDEQEESPKGSANGLFDDYESYNKESSFENDDLYDDETQPKAEKKQKSSSQKITIVQICTCVIILIAAVIVKTMGGSMYAAVKQWYTQHLNDSIVAQDIVTTGKAAVDRVINDAIAHIES